jgi:hypothetical protein
LLIIDFNKKIYKKMNSLFDLLQNQLGGEQFTNAIGNQLGMGQDQSNVAVESAISAILAGLSKNVSTEQGASSFLGALDRDHDGSILNDVFGYLQGSSNHAANPSMLNGAGILNHVLGNSQSGIVEAIAKMAGIDSGKSGQLLMTLAPIVMGLLGKMKNSSGVNSGTLIDLISKTGRPPQQVQEQQPSSGIFGVFGKMLDQDGDGNIMDDIASAGIKSVLGNLFKR